MHVTNEESHDYTEIDDNEKDHIGAVLTKLFHRMESIMLPDFFFRDPESCDELQQLHQKVKNTVKIDISSIPNAGTGLFATESIPAQSIVTYILSRARNGANMKDRTSCVVTSWLKIDQDYFYSCDSERDVNNLLYIHPVYLSSDFDFEGDIFIDSNPERPSTPGWFGNYINDGATINNNTETALSRYLQSSYSLQNCVLIPFGPSPMHVAFTTRTITKGEELLTSYGMQYWIDAILDNKMKAGPWPLKLESIRLLEKEMAVDLYRQIQACEKLYHVEVSTLHSLFEEPMI
eukprot:CAMPEP_0171326938 /NCGR_PEP_ID=MMETSP0816-20121228/117771_1 /TAXON_ID=420281 /ORGANISM="Proboscia inermis, Strain CCAP1064/1" /LENGTH=290 /DNA_ID=CAMNT_0011826541 /DNA_START=83 /DNA_END=956 /DNA_ORIENTATION=-